MERQEPRFDKDMKDVEFRPRTYRGPSLPSASHRNEGFAWNIGVAVGIGVLAALLISHPVPPGCRCAGGTLLYRDGNVWAQITARSNHVYCPDAAIENCYPVTPRSVRCVL